MNKIKNDCKRTYRIWKLGQKTMLYLSDQTTDSFQARSLTNFFRDYNPMRDTVMEGVSIGGWDHFQGDIYLIEDGALKGKVGIGQIDEYGGFYSDIDLDQGHRYEFRFGFHNVTEVTKIGNIFENPELEGEANAISQNI